MDDTQNPTFEPGTPNKTSASWALGERSIFLSVSSFLGQPKIHVRYNYRSDLGRLTPTKYGIALNRDEWERFKAHIHDVDRALEALADESDEHARVKHSIINNSDYGGPHPRRRGPPDSYRGAHNY